MIEKLEETKGAMGCNKSKDGKYKGQRAIRVITKLPNNLPKRKSKLISI